jgi:hypothetical protein
MGRGITRLAVALLVAGVGLASPSLSYGQTYRAPGIYPVFDGWEELPDGSKLFYFGYMNRHPTEIQIPLGADNGFEPAPVDRLQPTNFLPGRNEHVFTIKMPKDFNGKLVWTLKSGAGIQKATASLNQLYILEIEEEDPGTPHLPPPTVTAAAASVKLASTLALAPTVKAQAPARVANIEGDRGARGGAGVSVTWNKHRGPGEVTFTPAPGAPARAAAGAGRGRAEAANVPGLVSVPCASPVTAACGAAQAKFSEPGEYILRAVAHQGREQSDVLVRVTVTP